MARAGLTRPDRPAAAGRQPSGSHLCLWNPTTAFPNRKPKPTTTAEDVIYRSVWDADGSVHWGVFDHANGANPGANGNGSIRDQFLAAGIRLNELMVAYAGINAASTVLDVGCGNGATATWLCRHTHAQVTGIDLSGVRIDNARAALETVPELAGKLAFEKASAAELPFPAAAFTHVWSQATIYHVPDKVKALQEAHRVLQPGGAFIFDDLIKPRPDISPAARQFVYDRLLFDTDFSFYSYIATLRDRRLPGFAGPRPLLPPWRKATPPSPPGRHRPGPRWLSGTLRLPGRRLPQNRSRHRQPGTRLGPVPLRQTPVAVA